MPHIIIEHSDNFTKCAELNSLAQDLHNTLAVQETIKIEGLKTRTQVSCNCIIGDGSKKEFLHITLALLPGRNQELKQKFIDAIKQSCQKYYNPSECSFSIEVKELQTYFTQR